MDVGQVVVTERDEDLNYEQAAAISNCDMVHVDGVEVVSVQYVGSIVGIIVKAGTLARIDYDSYLGSCFLMGAERARHQPKPDNLLPKSKTTTIWKAKEVNHVTTTTE